MSIASEINRLQQAKSDLATSIEAKGVTVPAATTLDGYASLVDQIQAFILPYDAEIKYLKSTGTQYINTGIICDNNSKVEIKLCSEFNESATGIFGCRTFSPDILYTFYEVAKSGSNLFRTQVGYGATYYTNNKTTMTDYTLILNKNKLYINGSLVNTFSATTFTAASTSLLFTARSGGSADSRMFKGKIYYCKIWGNDTLVRDFIPVRVGIDGMMYDKVSKRLFANAGTGNFTLGNDVNV